MFPDKQTSEPVVESDFKARIINRISQQSILTLDDITALFKNGAVDEAIGHINESIVFPAADYYYNKAGEYFYADDYISAEKIYLKLAALENPDLALVVDKSEFDLYVLYLNTGDYEKSVDFKKQGRVFAINPVYYIKSILRNSCKFKAANIKIKNELNLNPDSIKKIQAAAYNLYIQRCDKGERDYYEKLSSREYAKFNEITPGNKSIFDQYIKSVNDFFTSVHNAFYTFGFPELKYALNLPVNIINYETQNFEEFYIVYFEEYLKEKIIEIKNSGSYITTTDDYDFNKKQNKYYNNIAMTLKTKDLSDEKIAYAIFKNCIFYMNSILGVAALFLIKDASIIHSNILQLSLRMLSLMHSKSKALNRLYQLYINNNQDDISQKINYILYTILYSREHNKLSGIQKMLKEILSSKNKLPALDDALLSLALIKVNQLKATENTGNIDIDKKNNYYLKIAIKNIMDEYNCNAINNNFHLSFQESLSIQQNLGQINDAIGLKYFIDIRIMFLDDVAEKIII